VPENKKNMAGQNKNFSRCKVAGLADEPTRTVISQSLQELTAPSVCVCHLNKVHKINH